MGNTIWANLLRSYVYIDSCIEAYEWKVWWKENWKDRRFPIKWKFNAEMWVNTS